MPGPMTERGCGTAPPRGFSAEELRQRTQCAQDLMNGAGLDALLLTTEPEVRYFSGFLTRFWESPTRPWFLIVPAAGKPVAVIPGIGADLMAQTWLDDIRTWSAPRPEDDGVSLLADSLRKLAGSKGRIGLPMGHESSLRMPLGDFNRLRAALPGHEFADAGHIIQALQRRKSEAEIAKIAHICAITGRAFDDMATIAAVGTPLDRVFREFQMALLRHGADWVPYLAGGAGPDGYGDVISPPSERALQRGDVLMLDTGAVHDGYFSDFDRNFAIARASDRARRAYDTLYAATEAGLAAARPGATCADLHAAMQAVIAGNHGGDTGRDNVGSGDTDTGRFGHGLGSRLTEWPSLIPSDRTELEPGMVLTLEPSLGIAPGTIMVHEENIVIREHGCELLSPRAPDALPVLV